VLNSARKKIPQQESQLFTARDRGIYGKNGTSADRAAPCKPHHLLDKVRFKPELAIILRQGQAKTLMKRHIGARSFRSLILLALLISLIGARAHVAYASGNLTLYPTEQGAQKHCPQDTVVWLNLPSGIYHFKGERWYGKTKSGAFVCAQEANKAGDRATRNGQ
jgi:hypothetical protein